MANRYWVLTTGGSWDGDSTGKWSTTSGGSSGAAEPTSADDVFFNANSGTNTVTAETEICACRSLNFTGYTGTFRINKSDAIRIGDGTVGHVTLGSGMTFSSSQDWYLITFQSTTGPNNITSNGIAFPCRIVFDGVGGSWTLQDAFACTGNDITAVKLSNGTLNTNGKSVTIPDFRNSDSGVVSTLTLGASTITCTSTEAEFTMHANNTLTANTATIVFSSTSATNKNFNGGGKTYNLFNITGGGAGIVIFAGSNTFANLPQITGGTKNLRFTAGTTQTFTGGTDFGNGSNLVTIDTETAGSAAILSKASGTIDCTSISLKDSTATGGAAWYAGPTPPSVDVSGNSGWIFTAKPVTVVSNIPRLALMGVG